jgi:heptosyltransferase-2
MDIGVRGKIRPISRIVVCRDAEKHTLLSFAPRKNDPFAKRKATLPLVDFRPAAYISLSKTSRPRRAGVKIGVLLPNWVGDVVLATPTLRALRRQFPAAQITAIARSYLLPLLNGSDLVTRSLAWEHHGPGWLRRTWQLASELRRERLSAVLVLRNSGFAAAIARASGARQVVGYARRASRLFLTTALSPPIASGRYVPISAVDYYLKLAETLGCDTSSPRLELATTDTDEAAADAIWDRLGLPDPRDVVLLNAGGAYGSAKHWPPEHSIELARRIADEMGLSVVVLCGPGERVAAAALAEAAGHPRVQSLADEDVRFGPTKALLRRARLLVTTDSGPRHIAAAVGTPTITLFGPIDPRWSENYQPGAVQLRLPLACSPCGRRTCPLSHHECMRGLTPEFVLRAVERLLSAKHQNTSDTLTAGLAPVGG